MDEAARKKFCNLIMFDVAPPNPKTAGNQMPIMVDYTTSLETSCMQNSGNFVFTSFVEPIQVRPDIHRPRKKLPSETPNNARDSNTPLSTPNIFVDESNAQQSQSESQARRTPRPPNAFILYRKAKQPDVIKKRGHTSNAKLSRILAEMWRNEPEEVKYEWKKTADRKKMEHSLQYPGYVYRPKKSGHVSKKKENKRRNDKSTSSTNSVIVINSNPDTNNVTFDPYNIASSSSSIMADSLYSSTAPFNDESFESYLKRSWEEHIAHSRQEQYHQQEINFPYTDISFFGSIESVTDQFESEKQVNSQFTAEQYCHQFPQMYDYHQPLTNQFLVANLDPPYPNDPIIQANLL